MINQLYYIAQYSGHTYEHGGVGYTDIESLLSQYGFRAFSLPGSGPTGIPAMPQRLMAVLRFLRSVRQGSTVVFIHPVFARMNRILLRLLAARGVSLVCILADIDGEKDGDPGLLRKELSLLTKAGSFVVHNEKMQDWLLERIPGARVARLNFFDFRVALTRTMRVKSMQVVFAGNLAKSGFLEKLGMDGLRALQFNLYGPGLPAIISGYPNCSYRGSFSPSTLPERLEGSFGLVWDGNGTGSPEGPLGAYMSLISQHKLSLYIVAGLPVIIHSSAACAGLVVNLGIGFTVQELREIPEKIKALPEESFQLMRSSMIPLAEKISTGSNLLSALQQLGLLPAVP